MDISTYTYMIGYVIGYFAGLVAGSLATIVTVATIKQLFNRN